MTHTPRPQTVLYLAESEATAREGAAALEAVPSTRERTVYPLSTASARTPSTWMADVDVDCVVFAETPTTASGASLLEVSEVCEETPLVLFTDAAYAPRTAHATEGVDGYVRTGTDDAVSHLADEIEWVCQDAAGSESSDAFRTAFEALPEPALRYERVDGRLLVRAVSDSFVDVFAIDRETLVDSPIGDDEGVVPPGLEGQHAVLSEVACSTECRQLTGRHDTATGVRTFELTVVPCLLEATDCRADGLVIYSDVTGNTQQERTLAATQSRLETVADGLEGDVQTLLHVADSYLEAADRAGTRAQFAAVEEAQTRLRERVDELASIARRNEAIGELEPVAVHDIARRAWAAVATGEARLVTPEATDRILEADKRRLQDLFEHRFQSVLEPGQTESTQHRAVVVRSTDDGFVISSHDTNCVPAVGDGGLEAAPSPKSKATADGGGIAAGLIERIADAHGWTVASTSDEKGTTFVVFGVDDAELT